MKWPALTILFIVAAVIAWVFWPRDIGLPPDAIADRVLILKGKRTLILFAGNQEIASYRIALGRNPVGPKEREGDGRTPEGIYRVTEHKSDSSFFRALRLSYPEDKDRTHAASIGVPPGSDIMIHGLPNGSGHIGSAHLQSDWTEGCIAVTNSEMAEIFRVVEADAIVEIRE